MSDNTDLLGAPQSRSEAILMDIRDGSSASGLSTAQSRMELLLMQIRDNGASATVLSWKGAVADMTALNAITEKNTGDVYHVTADGNEYAWSGSEWELLGSYTDTEKSKLAGIEAGAEVNVLEAITVGGDSQTVTNKTVALGSAAGASTASTVANDSTLPTGSAVKTYVDNAIAGIDVGGLKYAGTVDSTIIEAVDPISGEPTWVPTASDLDKLWTADSSFNVTPAFDNYNAYDLKTYHHNSLITAIEQDIPHVPTFVQFDYNVESYGETVTNHGEFMVGEQITDESQGTVGNWLVYVTKDVGEATEIDQGTFFELSSVDFSVGDTITLDEPDGDTSSVYSWTATVTGVQTEHDLVTVPEAYGFDAYVSVYHQGTIEVTGTLWVLSYESGVYEVRIAESDNDLYATTWYHDSIESSDNPLTTSGSYHLKESSIDITITSHTASHAYVPTYKWHVLAGLDNVILGSAAFADTATSVSTTSANKGKLPTNNAVSTFVTGKGYQTSSQVQTYVTGLGYQTAAQVQNYVGGLGYQTASQVQALIDASVGAAIAASYPSFDPSTVTWASGSWSDIAAMLNAHYLGLIDIHDYWNVGDTRTVSLPAISAFGVSESHVAQDVELVLLSADHYDLSDNSGKAAFVWGCKNVLANGTSREGGGMNNSDVNAGGWDSCARRTWCNSVFKTALPSELQALLKQVDIVTSQGSTSHTSTTTSQDYIFLPAEKEVLGSVSGADSTAESSLVQYTWYETAANRIKKQGVYGSATYWWDRSPLSGQSNMFCTISGSGGDGYNMASWDMGIAPHGCI